MSRPVIDYISPAIGLQRRSPELGVELFKLAALASVFIEYGVYGPSNKPVDLFFNVGLLSYGIIAVTFVAVRFQRNPDPPPRRKIRPRMMWAILGLFLLTTLSCIFLPFGYYSCPHGQRWANNQIGLAYSTNGGPCGNGDYFRGDAVWHVTGPWYVYRPHR